MDQDTDKQETIEARQTTLDEGYREMAADREQETEAEEWAEALIGDIDEEGALTDRIASEKSP